MTVLVMHCTAYVTHMLVLKTFHLHVFACDKTIHVCVCVCVCVHT